MLQDSFTIAELTHPVRLGGADTRGILDSAGETTPLAGTSVQFIGTVLYLIAASVPGIQQGATVEVGPLGAAALGASPASYRIGLVQPIEDGLLVACQLGGGR